MTLKEIVEKMFFVGILESEILESWDYRKGKDINDIRKAWAKVTRDNRRPLGEEMDEFEQELSKVLKKKRKQNERGNENGKAR